MYSGRELHMKRASIAVMALIGVSLGACVTAEQSREDMLSAAGFKMRPAATSDQIASLKKLPPHKFFVQVKNDQPIYFYADPTVCSCLYYGTQQNYQAYQQLRLQRSLADERQLTAAINQQTAFDMGPWGAFGPWGAPGYW